MFHGFLTMDLQMNMNLEIKTRKQGLQTLMIKLPVPIAWERGEYTCMASRANICCTLGMQPIYKLGINYFL